MSLTYISQPVTVVTKHETGHTGEISNYAHYFIIDASGKEIGYLRPKSCASSAIAARNAEQATVAAAIATAINAL